MAIGLYMDVHVPQAITDQLRRRGIDVVTAIEDGAGEHSDEQLMERALLLGRVIFTQDIRFHAKAIQWRTQDRAFAGLVFGHPFGGTIGQYVRDLELIATASEITDWLSAVERLPL